VLFAIVALAMLVTFVVVDLPVDRRRVEVFAARQDLAITRDNAALVIAYLARTRRWRAAGLVGGVTWYTVGALRHDTIGINIGYALVGWFAGALVAEAWISGPARTRSAASLIRRTPGHYLPSSVWAPLAGTAVLCAVLAIPGWGGRSWVWLAAAVGLPAVVILAGTRIRLRPQPLAAPDMLAADDAIRRRSMRVLTASAVTLLAYCVLDEALTRLTGAAFVLVMLAGAIAVPVGGWRMAHGVDHPPASAATA
jgi:hypothetical protein